MNFEYGRRFPRAALQVGGQPPLYELVATINHHGRKTKTGHYTAMAKRRDGTWWCFNDAVASTVREADVLRSEDCVGGNGSPYMLVYRQIG